jgi:putative membrane protein
MLVAYLYPGVSVESFGAALLAALVLGLVNAVVRPILVILTFPVTLLTLGLFLFVINALLFWLVAEIVKGFTVSGFMGALIGSILYSLITLITSWILFSGKKS